MTAERDPLVDLISGQKGMADRLMREHADDGTGRCKVCSGGAMTGRYAFPCTLWKAAETAARWVSADDATNGTPR
ncbi:hypothetical protein ACQEVB_22180 [Pseudonocardia sp. CA-107938]|uniref:hypothetical protein n=1 Tax=Pseudonocardia sp. CA-107938 TaxID=3240021 RepID=UPI003D8CE1E5